MLPTIWIYRPSKIDNMQMGYVFEELIRIGAEQANEEAGEHFTPREVIKLMVNLLLSPETDLRKSHVVKTIYDPACGTGGMLSVAENYIRTLNSEAQPHLYGQDWNDEAYAICRADMLIKGEEADNIKPECTFEHDGFSKNKFDYMLANPPFGVEWKQQQKTITDEHEKLGYDGRFGAGLPRINDGSLLFLQTHDFQNAHHRKMVAAVSVLSLMVRRFLPVMRAAANPTFVSGLLKMTGWKRLLPCRISFSITPEFPLISGSSPTARKESARERFNSLTPVHFMSRCARAWATNAIRSAMAKITVLIRLRRSPAFTETLPMMKNDRSKLTALRNPSSSPRFSTIKTSASTR